MKKVLLSLGLTFVAVTMAACQPKEIEVIKEVEKIVEIEVIKEVEVEVIKEVSNTFYTELFFEGSGYTPGYNYYLSGTVNEEGQVIAMRYDMVSVYGTSKRSSDYKMNVANVTVGGTEGNQTFSMFIGGSTENIAQVYNTVNGSNLNGEDLALVKLTFAPSYYGPVTHQDEIWGALADSLDITIDEATTVAELLTAMGMYNTETGTITNGYKQFKLKGYWGGGTYDQQLTAVEDYIVDNGLTLMEAYEIISTSNQGSDLERDSIAGATVMFDSKMVEIFRVAAGAPKQVEGVVDTTVDGDNTIYTVEVNGLEKITVKVTVDALGTIVEMVVTDHSETASLGGAVIEGAYIQGIIDGQDNLDGIDAVAGSTLTSNALVEAARKTLEQFQG